MLKTDFDKGNHHNCFEDKQELYSRVRVELFACKLLRFHITAT